MSGWTHVICAACYATREPGRTPVRLRDPLAERCCFCGELTAAGIYYRADPRHVPLCPGHDEE